MKPATVEELVAGIEDEAEGAADRLRAALVMSRQLADTGDALLEHFVSDARRSGMPWVEIGELFGMSRQAAQQRYGPGSASIHAWPGRWSPAARSVLERAGERAQQLNHSAVGTAHVLLELVTGEGGAAEVLAELGVTREGILAQGCLGPGASAPAQDCLGVRPRLKRALEHAHRIADALGHRHADTDHLLGGLLAVPDGLAIEILTRCHVDTS